MDIRWLGNSTFEVKSSAGVVVVDHQGDFPAPADLEDENTIFIFSQGDHTAHPPSDFHVLTGPGEYEIGGVSVRGVATPADDPVVSKNLNTVYVVEADGLNVAMLGNPGAQPSAQSVQQISKVDVLIINTEAQGLETEEMATVIRTLEPKIVVPSGYDSEASKPSAAMSRLLTELGVKEFEPTTRLTVNKTGLPEERTVAVLQQR